MKAFLASLLFLTGLGSYAHALKPDVTKGLGIKNSETLSKENTQN